MRFRLCARYLLIGRQAFGRRSALAGVASVVGILLALANMPSAYANCLDAYQNNNEYCPSYLGCTASLVGTYYTEVSTQSGPCYWVGQQGTSTCPFVYMTEGAKGNLGTGGEPFVYNTTPKTEGTYCSGLPPQNIPRHALPDHKLERTAAGSRLGGW